MYSAGSKAVYLPEIRARLAHVRRPRIGSGKGGKSGSRGRACRRRDATAFLFARCGPNSRHPCAKRVLYLSVYTYTTPFPLPFNRCCVAAKGSRSHRYPRPRSSSRINKGNYFRAQGRLGFASARDFASAGAREPTFPLRSRNHERSLYREKRRKRSFHESRGH